MNAGMRRVPAERARHVKRLGHVQAGPGAALPIILPDTTTTTTRGLTTSSGSQTVISTSRSLSVVPSSTIPSSSSTTSTTSTASTPSSTSAQPLTLPSLSINTSPTVSLSLSPISTPTPTSNVTAAPSRGLSGGAIAGIIAGATVVGAVLVVFLIRKTYLRRRERMRMSWSGAPGLETDVPDEPKPHLPDISEWPTPHRNVPPSPFGAHGQPMHPTPLAHMQPPTTPIYAAPTPPPASYNNPTPVGAYPPHRAPSVYTGTGTGTPTPAPPTHAQNSPPEAIVKCTFVPTLPDELSIMTGERVLILEQYDDGWNLCANARGERGMVPRDCLDHIPIDHPDTAWRNAGRTSSLNPDGRH